MMDMGTILDAALFLMGVFTGLCFAGLFHANGRDRDD